MRIPNLSPGSRKRPTRARVAQWLELAPYKGCSGVRLPAWVSIQTPKMTVEPSLSLLSTAYLEWVLYSPFNNYTDTKKSEIRVELQRRKQQPDNTQERHDKTYTW